ncbi:hypothetical protein ACFXPY_45180 [Streptomyces sp. NPDC059153]|uniref:hypothetical protein n=1 Tax=Streptomyces sp. NPDC059153 TaxID=3346743 RepID=UPI0036A40311
MRSHDAGLIRHLGTSGIKGKHATEAWAVALVVCVQNRYSLRLVPHMLSEPPRGVVGRGASCRIVTFVRQ